MGSFQACYDTAAQGFMYVYWFSQYVKNLTWYPYTEEFVTEVFVSFDSLNLEEMVMNYYAKMRTSVL